MILKLQKHNRSCRKLISQVVGEAVMKTSFLIGKIFCSAKSLDHCFLLVMFTLLSWLSLAFFHSTINQTKLNRERAKMQLINFIARLLGTNLI